MPFPRFLPVLIALAAVCACGLAWADQKAGPVAIDGVRVGFEGKYRVGVWCPVYVTLKNSGGPLAGHLTATTGDAENGPCTFTTAADVTLPAGESRIPLYVRFGRLNSTLEIAFQPADGPAARRIFSTGADDYPRALLSTQRLYVALGTNVDLERAIPSTGRDDSPEHSWAVTVTDPALLPDEWYGYEGVSAVVLPTASLADPAGDRFLARITARQWAALDRWVKLGGKLIWSCAAAGPMLAKAGANDAANESAIAALRRLLPGRAVSTFQERFIVDLESKVQPPNPLDLSGGKSFMMLELADLEGKVEAAERFGAASRPLVVRRPYGLGVVAFLAADLDREPFSSWSDRPLVLKWLLELVAVERTAAERDQGNQLTHIGFTDLAGQLWAALEDFPAVWTIPFMAIVGLVVLYALLIGPADWFFYRRYVSTWIMFPVVILATCLLAYLLVGMRRGELAVNQLEIVDIDAAGQGGEAIVRGTTWAHIYSPETRLFDLSYTPAGIASGAEKDSHASDTGKLLAWDGLPGTAFGGIDRTIEPSAWPRDYRLLRGGTGQDLLVAGLPIQTGATRALIGRWWDRRTITLGTKLTGSVTGPTGEVENPLAIPLDDCRLLYDRWMYTIGKLAPGERWRIERSSTFGDLEYQLQRRRAAETKDARVPWNKESRELDRIAELILLHEAAGGRYYSGLTQRSEPVLDLTPTLRAGRAILIGRSSQPAAQLTDAGQPLAPKTTRRSTWYRIVLPVAAEQ